MERVLVVILVSLLSVFVVDAQRRADEDELRGPRDVKAFVGRKGGGIRLYHDRPPPGKRGRGKTGEIEIRIGRIRETNGNDTEDDDGPGQRPPRPQPQPGSPRQPGPPGQPPQRPPVQQGPPRPPPPPPRRPKLDRVKDIDFEVKRQP